MKSDKDKVDNNFKLPMTKNFIESLMDVTLCTDINELKNHIIFECVWKEMEKKLNVDYESLRNFWNNQLHMQLFCSQPIFYNDINIKLIEYLYQKGIKHKKEIKWQNVISCFDGMTSNFLYRVFCNLIKLAKSRIKSNKFEDLITYLYDEHIPYLLEKPKDKMLPRLIYCDGNIYIN